MMDKLLEAAKKMNEAGMPDGPVAAIMGYEAYMELGGTQEIWDELSDGSYIILEIG